MKTENYLAKNSSVDITVEKLSDHTSTLNLVGMSDVELPIILEDDNGLVTRIPAKSNLYISLDDPHAKGIHMSRLYLEAKKNFDTKVLSYKVLEDTAKAFVDSHLATSYSAQIQVAFELMLKRESLTSKQEGWRFYPVTLNLSFDRSKNIYQNISSGIEFKIIYSSTCPCSAALAKESNIENFSEKFAGQDTFTKAEMIKWLEESNQATPHAQRSEANIKIKFNQIPEKNNFQFWIDKFENILATPVQAAVKREDEKAFASLNGDNAMFSEDACRKLKASLEQESSVADYWIKIEHFESLHPHNAVSISVKGIEGGFKA